MSSTDRPSRERSYSVANFVGVVAERQTYKNLCYLAVAFPLGMVYSVVFLVGFGFGTVLSALGIGILLLIGTVIGSRLLVRFERWLANALLSVDLETIDDVRSSSAGLLATVRRYFDAPSTWRGLGFLMVKFWFGFVAIVLLVVFVTALSFLTIPFRYPHEEELFRVNDEPIVWTIDTLPEAALAVVLGAGLGLAFFHLSNAFAYVAGRIAIALLDYSSEAAATPTEPMD
ncbi:sensor domain-containing protein [Natronorubrum thiooxidans]|uniref:Putative sensor n=1 Tax=Natronorubrum thiooxidans TaxID=308853 RepID=A0A1N7CPC3_9EURY|nr:sensor domain-containing protein [Natronorubrum thiooxidans]SIR65347.1 Putative sensor [Natronorubrum thiooxidans]